MPRPWRDSTYDETDGLPRYDLVDRNGNIVARGVKVEVSSKVVQEGDRVGALAFNRTTELDDDGTPLLAIDGGTVNKPTGWQTVLRQDGGAVPAALLPGQFFAADNGDVYIGDSTGKPVLLGNQEAIASVQAALNQHAGRTDNPHGVSLVQLGAASAAALTGHTGNRSNPHGVTAGQVGAMPLSGGTFSENVTFAKRAVWTYPQDTSRHSTIYVAQNTAGEYFSVLGLQKLNFWQVRDQQSEDAAPIRASNISNTSSIRYKDVLGDAQQKDAERLLQATVKRFKFKGESSLDDGYEHIGLIAEELYEIAPEYIYGTREHNIEGIKYDTMVPELLLLIQKQQEQINTLQERLDTLENER